MEGNTQIIFAVTVFLLTYGIIVSEKIHRTIIALFGAVVLIAFGIVSQDAAIGYIDFNTLGLLIGMMLIVGIARHSGLFEFLAIWSAKRSKGKPISIMISLSIITAILSALLDNVTTVLLIVPVTIAIAEKLEISPIPIVFAEIILSNTGGTATLIGDPPNIMIGSATGLGFMDFLINMAPIAIAVSAVTILCLFWLFRKQLAVKEELRQRIMEMDEYSELKDIGLLKKSLTVIVLTIIGFVLHQSLHLESATVALAGAALLLLVAQPDPEHVFEAVEWPVIFFFAGLFILVGGLEEVGVIEWAAHKALVATGGALLPTGMIILWMSAIFSALVDNIPFVATMIPLMQEMGNLGGIENMNALWWSLALGACLGGNGTIIGASANVVSIGLLEQRGYRLTFLKFMKWGFPLMILSILMSTVYLYLFYLT